MWLLAISREQLDVQLWDFEVWCCTSSGGSQTSPRVDRETTRGPPAGGAAAAARPAYRVRCAALRSNPHGSSSMGDPTTKISGNTVQVLRNNILKFEKDRRCVTLKCSNVQIWTLNNLNKSGSNCSTDGSILLPDLLRTKWKKNHLRSSNSSRDMAK